MVIVGDCNVDCINLAGIHHFFCICEEFDCCILICFFCRIKSLCVKVANCGYINLGTLLFCDEPFGNGLTHCAITDNTKSYLIHF